MDIADDMDIQAEALRRIAICRETEASSLDLRGLRLGPDGAAHLAGLTWLTSLNLSGNKLGSEGAAHLAGLTSLTSLDLSRNRIGADGAAHLAGLASLTSLNLSRNELGPGDAAHLAGLTSLTILNLSYNELGSDGAVHLAGLTSLTSLDLSLSRIDAERAAHLASLTSLTSLNLWNNALGPDGAAHLAGLTSLTSLDLSYNEIGSEGAAHLAGLTSLTSLKLSRNDIGPEGAAHLVNLKSLATLGLSRNRIGADGALHLAGLTALTSLNLSDNGDCLDLQPLQNLTKLQSFECSQCRLAHPTWALWLMPTLSSLVLFDTHVPGVPADVLSPDRYTSCLATLRAHYADLDGEGAAFREVKLMLLGNGRVGKTKLARRLRGEAYGADDEASTHGVQVTAAPLAIQDGQPATLRIWDFGGQDIYHGTHGLFMRARAAFAILWTPMSEAEPTHAYDGLTYRNQPLGYWLAYVTSLGGPRSPLLLIQSQADSLADEQRPGVSGTLLDGFETPLQMLAYSAKTDRKRGTLNDSLVDAVTALHDRDGVVRIGAGRAWVKAALEAKLAEGAQLMARAEFPALCALARAADDGGPVSNEAALLTYLHNIGTVFYREGLFDERIILDQAWALEAVYAIFDRKKSWPTLVRYRGRFTRADLAELAWGAFTLAEQALFLSFMVQCGIAFVARKGDPARGIETEYVAPELLADRNDRFIAAELRRGWEEPADHEARITYDLLPPGLVRGLSARIGRMAGDNAVYWRDGVLLFDTETGARGLIEQEIPDGGWAGTLRIATARGRADALLEKLVALVEQENEVFVIKPTGMPKLLKGRGEEDGDIRAAIQTKLRIGREPKAGRLAYVSYAWADPADPARTAVVDQLCSAALARDIAIQRDVETLKTGDSIRAFMGRIGSSDRVFVVLSHKYWRSAYCMYELYEIWRNCRLDVTELRERTRVFALPCAKMFVHEGLDEVIEHWKTEHARCMTLELKFQEDGVPRLAGQELLDFRMMRTFLAHLADIRAAFRDLVQASSVDDYVEWALGDMTPDA